MSSTAQPLFLGQQLFFRCLGIFREVVFEVKLWRPIQKCVELEEDNRSLEDVFYLPSCRESEQMGLMLSFPTFLGCSSHSCSQRDRDSVARRTF